MLVGPDSLCCSGLLSLWNSTLTKRGEVGSRLSSLAGAVLRERQGRFDKSQAELVGDSERLD